MKGILRIFLVTILLSSRLAAQTHMDSALAAIPSLSVDTAKITQLIRLNQQMAAEGNVAGAMEVTSKAIAEVQKSGPNRAFLVFLQRMIDVYINHGNYPKALELCFTLKHMAQDLREESTLGDAINSIGIIYWYEGEYKKALPFFEDALKIHQKISGDASAAGILNNMGLIYRQTGDYDKAIEYYKKAIYYARKTGRDRAEANAYNNIGIVYQLKKEYANALKYFDLSLEIRKKIGDEIGITTSYGNIGMVYFETKRYAEAEKYLRESYAISQRIDDVEGIKETGQDLSELYELQGKPDSALKYYKIFITARDTLINEATKRDALKREMEYKFEREQEKKAILDEAEKRKQRIFTFSIILILVLISVFTIALLKRIRVTNRQKHIIEEKNSEILSSIHYAKRIQQSLLTSEKYIARSLQRLRGSKH